MDDDGRHVITRGELKRERVDVNIILLVGRNRSPGLGILGLVLSNEV
jgi:hypothetical protein